MNTWTHYTIWYNGNRLSSHRRSFINAADFKSCINTFHWCISNTYNTRRKISAQKIFIEQIKVMIFHSPCNWFGIHSIHKEKILHNSNNYLNLLSDFLTYTFKYIFKEIISLTLTYLSYEFINIVRKHQYFREFILENAALDYSASGCNGIQLEHSWVKVFWRSVSLQISPKGRKDMCTFFQSSNCFVINSEKKPSAHQPSFKSQSCNSGIKICKAPGMILVRSNVCS